MKLPENFEKKMRDLLKEDFDDYIACYEEPRYYGLRVNTNKISVEEFKKICPFEIEPIPWIENGFYYDGEHVTPSKHPYYFAGLYYLQEPSAMTPANRLPVEPGDKVLDVCAAPGGKATELGAKLQGEGVLAANDISNSRAKGLLKNIEVFGIGNVLVLSEEPGKMESYFTEYFDKILIDAPCSGEGMFRKNPNAIKEWTEESPLYCQKRQQEILSSAIKMLKNKGQLIYSTCTFAPEENEEIISWLVENYPVTIEEIPLSQTVSSGRPEWGSVAGLEKTIRIWPHKDQGEGHFVAKLTFHGQNQMHKEKKTRKKSKVQMTKEQEKLWTEFSNDFHYEATGRLLVFNDHLWEVPELAPSLDGLKVVRTGLHLGDFKKNRFEPSYALALATKKIENIPCLPITQKEWQSYTAGETFQRDGNQGWVLLVLDKIPVGFGKQVKGTVKNFFPKGLRFH